MKHIYLTQESAGNTSPQQPKLRYSRKEAASKLNMSLRTLDRRIAEKELHVRRDGHRVFLILDELRRYSQTDHGTKSRKTGRKQSTTDTQTGGVQ
jgi:hypothetical protein